MPIICILQFGLGVILVIISSFIHINAIDINTKWVIQIILICTGFIIVAMALGNLLHYNNNSEKD